MDDPGTEISNRRSWAAVLAGTALVLAAFWVAGQRLVMPALGRANEVETIDRAFGATVEPLDAVTAHELGDGQGRGDLIVTSVASDGPAQRAGIRPGDVVEGVNGKPPVSQSQIATAVTKPPVTVEINRHGKHVMVTLPVIPKAGAARNNRG
jgi:S1-C subfamily serine protease